MVLNNLDLSVEELTQMFIGDDELIHWECDNCEDFICGGEDENYGEASEDVEVNCPTCIEMHERWLRGDTVFCKYCGEPIWEEQ